MEENEIAYVTLTEEQFTELTAELRQANENIKTVDASIRHASMFLILLVVFQLFGMFSRISKKGGV